MDITRKKTGPLRGTVRVPGDKSISHRAVMFGALAEGTTKASGFLMSDDCLSTIDCFRRLGIRIDADAEHHSVTVYGRGLHGLTPGGVSGRQALPASPVSLYTGNSGTTTRLISGILAGQRFSSLIDGDASIRKRPMKRILDPLTQMGSGICSEGGNGCAPLFIPGRDAPLHGIRYTSPVASAQVKSAVLLAGLYADGPTAVTEPAKSRDHTELMLSGFGAEITSSEDAEGHTACVQPEPALHGMEISVPGDISSAAYFLAAGLLVPGSEILIRHVGINPTRAGILQVLKRMGGDVTILNETRQGGEPCADLLVRGSSLKGCEIGGSLIPALIDELPVIAVIACAASGKTVIRDARELRVKESDRIESVTAMLTSMGADVTPMEDGMIIEGGRPLHGAEIQSFADHRIAMSASVAALIADGETRIKDAGCVGISYPDFYKDLDSLI